LLGSSTNQLLEQHGYPNTAPAGRIERILDGNIIIDHDALDRNAGVSGC
jgi:hypothetical protein